MPTGPWALGQKLSSSAVLQPLPAPAFPIAKNSTAPAHPRLTRADGFGSTSERLGTFWWK